MTEQENRSIVGPDEYAVYSALIERMHVTPSIDSVVIMNETVTNVLKKGDLEGTLRYVSENTSGGISKDVLEDFKAKSQANALLVDQFNTGVTRVLFSKEEVSQLYRNGGWAKFLEKYPRRGIISFSRVGFSKDQKLALVYTGTQSGGKSGWGYYVLLTKEGDTRSIRNKVEVWLS